MDELEGALRSAGLPVWRDTAELWPGQDWQARIRRAIAAEALVFLACFSRRSVMRRAGYQNAELALAAGQARLVRAGAEWLIPVRFDDCDLPDLDLGGGRGLDGIHRADLFGPRREAELDRLVTGVAQILGRRQPPAVGAVTAGPTYLQQVEVPQIFRTGIQ